MRNSLVSENKNYGSVARRDNPGPFLSDGRINDETMADHENLSDRNIRHNGGLTITFAAIFVAAEMAGSGILALPRAVVDSGWIGIILVVVFCINAAYGGSRLGDCWTILEERYPEYRNSSRSPYPTIAYRVFGKWGQILVSVCIQLTLFGAGTVYLLLASHMIQEILENILPKVGFCIWFLVFAALLCVPMWLGSPKDFCLIGIGALVMTVLSCIFIFTQIIIDGTSNKEPAEHVPHSFHDFFLAFGTILFAFGGASTFPTIQNDMNNKNDFYKSVRIAFVVILLLYLPITIAAYFVYGESVNPNVVLSMTPSVLTLLADACMACHLIMAFIIIINPVSQDLEEIFRIPDKFCVKRCVLRTLILCLMVFIGETIPKFNKILSLVGGSTVTLATFVFPPLFYMKLCDQESDEWPKRTISFHSRVYMWELIIIGIFGGIASTYSAVTSIIEDPISKPCYWPS